jgi:hypothetical protein
MRMHDRGNAPLSFLAEPERAAPATAAPPAPNPDAEAMRAAVDRLREDRGRRVSRLEGVLSRSTPELQPGRGRISLRTDGTMTFRFGPRKDGD